MDDAGIYIARLHGHLQGRWRRCRDLMCEHGLHWPLEWECSRYGRVQEQVCQRSDCRCVVKRRVLPAPPPRQPLGSVQPDRLAAPVDQVVGREEP
jgi:hypothetical protein